MQTATLADVGVSSLLRRIQCLSILAASLVLGGCAHWSSIGASLTGDESSIEGDATSTSTASADQAALIGMAEVLAQLRTPQRSTVQTRNHGSEHYRFLIETLSEMGYGIQRVNADQGAHFVELHRTPEVGTGEAGLFSYRLSVGAIELRRDYTSTDDGQTRPMGTLKVSGTRSHVTLDDSRFQLDDELAGRVSRVEYAAMTEAMVAIPVISLITDDVVAGVARSAAGLSPGSTSLQALNSSKVEVNNLFFGNISAFGDLRGDMDKVARETVIFPNDSLRLGSAGKAQIRRFLQQYRQGSDMIGLIGCSNGRTKLAIGNEGLALGRSERVTQELLSLGVAREVILDEGCWAPRSAGERFPSRGVVIELLRRQA